MAFDAGFLRAVALEINEELADSRLEKIFQCTRDTFVLEFRAAKKPRALFLAAGPSGGVCYLTEHKPSHPDVPPMFCMLLRKHLQGGRFLRAEQVGFERVLRLDIEFFDAFGEVILRSLYLETMGKNSNLILCDEDGGILGALRTLDLAVCPERPLLCGMQYTLPPERKGAVSLLSASLPEAIGVAFARAEADASASQLLLETVTGIGPVTARELVYRASGDAYATAGQVDPNALLAHAQTVARAIEQGKMRPSAVLDNAAIPARVVEYSFLPLTQYAGLELCFFDSPCALMEFVRGKREQTDRLRMQTERASAILRAAQKRLKKKLDAQMSDYAHAVQGERDRLCGDLIMQEIYRISRGQSTLVATDYSTEESVSIALDTRLTPAQNAQRYYKRYQKSRRALAVLEQQLEQTREELAYAQSIQVALEAVETPAEADEICREVADWEYGKRFGVRQESQKKKKPAVSACARFVSPGGFCVLRGKNNLQNEELTFRIAAKHDLWFHAKGRPGPHVVLHIEGAEPPCTEDILFAARLALPRDAEQVGCQIDYTKIKFVKHHPSRLPGRVTYSGESTVFVRKLD